MHLKINFKSKELNMPVMVDVLMPQGHGNYKTLYLLHGAGGDHETWILNSRIADYVNNKNIAVIMPSGNNKFYINNIHGKKYGTFITKELINQCEKWFNLSRKAEDRFIAGMSMGGYGAVYSSLTNPGLYNTAFSYSGLLNILERYDNPHRINLFPVFGDRQQLLTNNLDINQVVNNIKSSNVENSTKYIITCGLQDGNICMNREFFNKAKEARLNVKYIEKDGTHDFQYWDECIKQTVKYICGEDTEWQL